MTVQNLTPHNITFRDANGIDTVYAPVDKDNAARVDTNPVDAGNIGPFPTQKKVYGDIYGLPAPQNGVIYIVSGFVLSALKDAGSIRDDVVAPATGPKDGAIRNDKNHIVAVTKFDRI
jgi:hypothetical protein